MTAKVGITFFFLVLVICMMLGAGCLDSSAKNQVTASGVPALSVTGITSNVSGISSGNCTPVTITQTDGSLVTLPCHPDRIIVANSNAAEMMIAIGAQDNIVGVTQSTTNVSYIRDKIPQAENIGDWQVLNVEKILSLHPDIVIAFSSSKPRNTDQLAAANITLVYLDCYRLSTLANDARALGALTGRSNEAEVYARMVEDTIAEVTAKVKTIPGEDYPDVYSEAYTDFTVSGPGSGAGEQLTLAGGNNIASDVATSSAKISTEWVVAKKPDYIIKVISSGNMKPFAEILASLKSRTGWDTIPGVKNDRVYLFANDVEFGPRAYIGLVYTAQLLHPDEFRDLHPRQMLDDYASRYVAGTNRTGMVYP